MMKLYRIFCICRNGILYSNFLLSNRSFFFEIVFYTLGRRILTQCVNGFVCVQFYRLFTSHNAFPAPGKFLYDFITSFRNRTGMFLRISGVI
ncbi:hypothetical protein PBCV1_a367R [Paramecium bursaria Chlorella virus 1]|uniref:Uncharacterized protein n=1 Tax=Paramecium bursaria Chlorella virus 1 TaxID=10506 RepID=Q98419_PBCV1|nr:hypothetical protein PBCV1_a367R [Paramecium bursaria Chlorella virus 1]AAC96735.1 hypothetical protein [Paramecium bursaria Chlorella virus 1]